MDSGNKINEELVKIKNSFLDDKLDLTKESRKKGIYDLEKEFEKTRKNKNYILSITFILVLIFIMAGTVVAIYLIQNNSRKIDVSFKEFEDVVLQDILNSSSKYESQLVLVSDELKDLLDQKKEEINDVKLYIRKQKALLNEQRLNEDDKVNLLKDLAKEEKKRLTEIQKRYKGLIDNKQKEIKKVKAEVASYKQMRSKSGANEELLTTQTRIQEIQMARVVDFYERRLKKLRDSGNEKFKKQDEYYNELLNAIRLKYNPKFEEQDISSIINSSLIEIKEEDEILMDRIKKELLKDMINKGIITKEDFDLLVDKKRDRDLIMKYFKDIPYENNVPAMISHLDNYDKFIINEYHKMLYKALKKQGVSTGTNDNNADNLLSVYINAVDSSIDKSNIGDMFYTGYILKVSGYNNIDFKLDSKFKPKNNQVGYIVDKKNALINQIIFTVVDSKIRIKLKDNTKIEPLDRIYVSTK